MQRYAEICRNQIGCEANSDLAEWWPRPCTLLDLGSTGLETSRLYKFEKGHESLVKALCKTCEKH